MGRYVDFVLVAEGVARAGADLSDSVQVGANVVLAGTFKVGHEALEREGLQGRQLWLVGFLAGVERPW
jgi:hypothetical protein